MTAGASRASAHVPIRLRLHSLPIRIYIPLWLRKPRVRSPHPGGGATTQIPRGTRDKRGESPRWCAMQRKIRDDEAERSGDEHNPA